MVNSIFSLELLSMTKVAVLLYSDPDISVSQNGFVSVKERDTTVEKKLSNLDLPPVIKRTITRLSKPLSDQIKQWVLDHLSILNFGTSIPPNKYVFKDNGTIDRIKTAKNYIENENNNVYLRFLMASVYWFEEEARTLWNEMPRAIRSHLFSIRPYPSCPLWLFAVMHWIVYIRSGDADWRQHFFSPSWYCEDRVVLQGNLLQQLTPEEQLGVFKGLMKDSTHRINMSWSANPPNREFMLRIT
ncbi:hypothetical protein NPIL_496141 [Nephila pilipes]|uniref:Uncharacterized protein n=1 Tax=Nephila pilipes TaxID=299642 RepID=A0A8X6TF75_NEPPI|nr:hypothetical protein NPIL_496141 [Nephila pilipes]